MNQFLNGSGRIDTDLGDEERAMQDRNVLALDALSKLARQFSNRPDLDSLMDLLLLTLSGQFSVTSAFAILLDPRSERQSQLYFAIGKFKQNELLSGILLTRDLEDHLALEVKPHKTHNLKLPGQLANFGYILQECGVQMIMPLVHDSKLIGLLGLGGLVAGRRCTDSDCELLTTMVNTVTPFIANSFLFLEISELNLWHLSILDSVKQGVFVFDSNDRLKKVNAAGFRILSEFKSGVRSIESLQAVPMSLIFSEKGFPGWLKRIDASRDLEHGKPLENMVVKKGDNERIFNVRVSRVFGETSRSHDLVITLDDITGQKQSEQRLFELEKFAEKGLMASSIAHELNNFLGLILGGVELAEVASKRNDSERLSGTLEKLKQTVAKMERFTAGLMDYSRMDTARTPQNLNTIITDVLSFVSVQKKFSNITISTQLGKALNKVNIDGHQIAQLLLNLLNNAADAIDEAGREIGEIVVRTTKENDSVLLSISDNGVGVKPELKDKLFRSSFTTKSHGHGYGLVTVGNIISNHEATFEVDSTLGKGTTFTFSFAAV
jgi:signal transduction histidine kinase